MTLINNASLNVIEFPYIFFFYGLVKIYVYKMFYVIKKKKKSDFNTCMKMKIIFNEVYVRSLNSIETISVCYLHTAMYS